MRSYICCLLFCFTLLFFCLSAEAVPQYVIRYSHLGVSEALVQASSAKAEVFKAELERLTKGKIKVEIFPAGQLAGQVSSVQQIRKGTIHIADISSGILASLYYQPLEIFDLPYIFSSRDIARAVLSDENAFTKKLVEDCADKTGIRILSLGIFGYRHTTNNLREIKTPADMLGLKMRTMEIVPHMKMMEAWGATPVPVPWLELYTSLQTKVVDGEETTLQNMIMGKMYQVQQYLSLTAHLMGVGAFLCNEKWFQSLPEEFKKDVIQAEKNSLKTYDSFGKLLDTVALKKLQAYGMQVYKPTPRQEEKFRGLALTYVRKWMEEKHGEQFVSDFFQCIENAREKLDHRIKYQWTYEGLINLLNVIVLKELDYGGLKKYTLTPKEMKNLRKKAMPSVRKLMEKRCGKEFVVEFFDAIEKAKNKLKDKPDSDKKSLLGFNTGSN